MSTDTILDTQEAVYYTLLLMPPSGNINETPGYTQVEIFDFWVANHESITLLAEHSKIVLTQALVDSSLALGAARALYKRVTADGDNSRYIINHLTRQLPVGSKRFLVSIGVFDNQIQAELETCRVVSSTYAPSPALASSVQPPKQPFGTGELSIVIPEGAIAGCTALAVATTSVGSAVALAGPVTGTCPVAEF